MKNKVRCSICFIMIFYLFVPFTLGQDINKYGLKVINDIQYYKSSCASNSNNKLIDLVNYIPKIVLDIRYASNNNFTKNKVYDKPAAFLRLPAAEKLKEVQLELLKNGIGIKVFDAYRPYAATLAFWELIKNPTYVASPVSGSRHNRGCAIDLTLIDIKTGKELEMPTQFDDFTTTAGAFSKDISLSAQKNRAILQNVMTKYGFLIYEGEWWHFDFSGWKEYDVMDIPFDKLNK